MTANDTLFATLSNAAPGDYVAANLNMEMTFYTNGIARTVLTQDGEAPRFAISDTGVPVVWEQLTKLKGLKGWTNF